jgi:hypothetical protein
VGNGGGGAGAGCGAEGPAGAAAGLDGTWLDDAVAADDDVARGAAGALLDAGAAGNAAGLAGEFGEAVVAEGRAGAGLAAWPNGSTFGAVQAGGFAPPFETPTVNVAVF